MQKVHWSIEMAHKMVIPVAKGLLVRLAIMPKIKLEMVRKEVP